MTLISPGDCNLQCGMWLWNHDSEFTKWQHPAMWYVALGSWYWIRQVAAPCNVAGGSGMTCHGIRPNVHHIWILHLVSISTISPQSTCLHQSAKYYPNRTTLSRKKLTSYRFSRWRISAILDLRGPIMGSSKSPCTTSYRSSIDTIALNCLVFEKIAFLHFGDRHTDTETSKQIDSIDALSRSRCRERRLNKPRGRHLLAASNMLYEFLPRDAMQARPMPSCGVCPSVTFMDSVEKNKLIFKVLSPSGSHTNLVFVARCDALARPMSSCGVCSSVCLPVTFIHSAETNEHIFKLFTLSGSQAIPVFPNETSWHYSNGNPP